MTLDRSVERDHGGRIVVGWVLVEALVRAVVVEMVDESVEDGAGVSFVIDQDSVGAFLEDAADESFRVAVRAGRPGRDFDDVETLEGEGGVEGGGEF
jgi:hypothetical protein